jgi:hypothetical protein
MEFVLFVMYRPTGRDECQLFPPEGPSDSQKAPRCWPVQLEVPCSNMVQNLTTRSPLHYNPSFIIVGVCAIVWNKMSLWNAGRIQNAHKKQNAAIQGLPASFVASLQWRSPSEII